MRKIDWLLLAVGTRIDPIQLQKTLFKFAQETPIPEAQKYQFIPYNWGPCATQIYPDLASLREKGYVEYEPNGDWNAYRVTDRGRQLAERLRETAVQDVVRQLDEKREWVTSRSFTQLLRDVYSDYPDYAERSLFRG